MRLALALVTLACAGSAAAEPVQDRYGPPRKAAATQARAYEGRLLGWAGKAAPQPPAAAEVAVRVEPQPQPPEVRAAAPVAPAAPPPRPAMTERAAAPLPQNLYDAPAALPAPPPRVTEIAAAPPPPPRPHAAPSRLYSLHREYGMAPDTVPATASGSNYVLIGPPDAPAEADEDEAPARKPSVDARLF